MLSATALRDEVLEFTAAIDPDAVPLPDASLLWTTIAEMVRALSGTMTVLVRRVEDAEAWRSAGFKNATDAIAATTGTSNAAAKQMLETSRNVSSLPAIADAMRAGTLSPQKAEVIAAAAYADPAKESELLATAGQSLGEVRTECLRVRAAAEGDALYARVRRQRRAHTYVDAEGAWNFCARGPSDKGAAIFSTLEDITEEIFTANYANGRREPREAYAFDALVEMARRASECNQKDEKPKVSRKPLFILGVSWEGLRRGWIEGEEVCEIAGVGPVPVRVARELLGDAVLKLVITKGTDVLNVTHLGRVATVAQQTALLWQSPICEVEGCNRTHRLEIDHRLGWAKTKRTRLDELQRLCEHHHDLKTRDGWELVEGTGRRPMVPPEHLDHPRSRPPP